MMAYNQRNVDLGTGKVRCEECGNLFEVDIDDPAKTERDTDFVDFIDEMCGRCANFQPVSHARLLEAKKNV